MVKVCLVLAVGLAVASALPASDPVISKWDDQGPRYDYLEADDGSLHLVDNWMKLSDYSRMARYNPDRTNAYHLFTWRNPTISQPLVMGDVNRLRNSNFDGSKRTIILMHGFMGSVTSGFNTVLVPAFLSYEDVNVIILDWSSGSHWGPNAALAAEAAARFVNWLNSQSGGSPARYHIVGYSVGGHGAAILARHVNGNVAYVTGLDPAMRWDSNNVFRPNDAAYTEIIHTNAGNMGILEPHAHVDFYPNGGSGQPGCNTALCDHYRSYYFMAETLRTGGFTGHRCNTLTDAQRGTCNPNSTLRMGGRNPKTGSRGLFFLATNPFSPFSRG
ncbi:pancreatic triacylglycerol lipase [Manduca sexta]|uniref:Esterase n=1 Tax=Manduca sexta TaxID=7130 RepID=A0A921ZQA5_MANSE|nr:pancreatic triacylglycerol lipase [Manduca sexta]KAG6462270.1 hypothetical protein O3G_MSEX013156 [Manduca sexta]UXP71886.1 esterase [Manduca sexta]